MMKTILSEYFKEGQVITHAFQITQGIYDAFQLCSCDMNPLHTDESFAISKGFKEKVMYGNILNAFVSYFIGMCLPTKNVIIHSQDIMFKSPVYLGDKLVFEGKVEEMHEAVNVVLFNFKFINESGKVCSKGHVQIGGI